MRQTSQMGNPRDRPEQGMNRPALDPTQIDHLLHWPSDAPTETHRQPCVLVRGRGATVWDTEGREFIDGTAILGVTQIGHGRKEMANAIARQIRQLEYASLSNGFSNTPAAELARKLAEITPGDLSISFFSSGGAEAIETALKMARHYHRAKGKPSKSKFLARESSYHGVTFGALSVSGLPRLAEEFEPLLPQCVHVPTPYPYRSELLDCEPADVGRKAAELLEATIIAEGPETIAAFIAEPVAMPLAVRVPPPDYWPSVREVCDRYDVLLILDEILTGFGRTGKLFACEHWRLEPDILVVAKGLTSGYVPLSASIATSRVAATFWDDNEITFNHASTYSGHPVACVAALENLAILEREDLIVQADQRGQQLYRGLQELRDKAFVGNISGIGLLACIELVTNRRTKTPAPREVGVFLIRETMKRGVLVRYMPNGIYIYPPLVISKSQVDHIIAALAESLAAALVQFADSWDG